METKKFWSESKAPLPRLRIEANGNNYLIQWSNISSIKANKNYTKIEFICETGLFKFVSENSMSDFFEALQAEKIRKVKDDGVRIDFIRIEMKEE